METNNNKNDQNREDSFDKQNQEQQRTIQQTGKEETSSGQNSEKKEPYVGADKDVSGNDITVEGRAQRAHHQQFGNRKYESNTNHSSADDQPTVNTGPGNF